MKKILIVTTLLMLFAMPTKAQERASIDLDYVNLILPGANTDIAYLYDFVGEKSLIGAESPFLKFNRSLEGWYLTLGYAKSINSNESDKGVGYLGAHFETPKFFNDRLSIGAYFGRDWEQKENIAGLKSNIKLW